MNAATLNGKYLGFVIANKWHNVDGESLYDQFDVSKTDSKIYCYASKVSINQASANVSTMYYTQSSYTPATYSKASFTTSTAEVLKKV